MGAWVNKSFQIPLEDNSVGSSMPAAFELRARHVSTNSLLRTGEMAPEME